MFFIYNLFYINFLQVFSIKFAVNLFTRHLVYFSRTTREIRVTRPFIVSFIPGDQYGGPDCFISCLHVLFTEINQIKTHTSDAVPTSIQRLLNTAGMSVYNVFDASPTLNSVSMYCACWDTWSLTLSLLWLIQQHIKLEYQPGRGEEAG